MKSPQQLYQYCEKNYTVFTSTKRSFILPLVKIHQISGPSMPDSGEIETSPESSLLYFRQVEFLFYKMV